MTERAPQGIPDARQLADEFHDILDGWPFTLTPLIAQIVRIQRETILGLAADARTGGYYDSNPSVYKMWQIVADWLEQKAQEIK